MQMDHLHPLQAKFQDFPHHLQGKIITFPKDDHAVLFKHADEPINSNIRRSSVAETGRQSH